MPDQQPHTPTTEEVRLAHAESVTFHQMEEPELTEANSMFDRFLAARDARIEAAAEQRGAIKALLDARHDWYKHAEQMEHAPGKYYAGLWMKDRADRITDQMEGDVANQGDWCHAEHCPYRGTGKMPTHRRHEHCPVWRTNA